MKLTHVLEPLDAAFVALSNRHRRRLLVALMEEDRRGGDPVLVPEDAHDGDRRLEALHVELRHVHLPKLEEHGLVDWDRDSHRVRKGPTFDSVAPLVALLDDHADVLPGEWV